MRRIPDLIDVWFDSGAMPFAQWHYPFENEDKFKQNFPADFIAEGVDQTRGWFYTLHAIASLVMDEKSYKNVVVNGLLLDDKGEKMSKSKGNAIDPFAIIKAEGADAVRWYMMSNTPPWENLKFAQRGLLDTKRKFFGTLHNVYSFFATYANIDGFVNSEARIPVAERAELDRWVVSRLNTTIELVDKAYASYHPTRAARAVERFVEELSNWYIRRSRRRFWSAKKSNGDAAAGDRDKLMAYQTVYESLLAVSKMISPIAPFFSEWLYESLVAVSGATVEESVHLALFPEVELEAVDSELEHRMQLARTISSVVLSLRNKSNINVRQPLSRIMVVTGPSVDEESVAAVKKIILDEVNVKDIEYISGASTIVNRSAKANFKLLGRRLGKQMKSVAGAVKALDAGSIDEFLSTGILSLSIEGQDITLEGDEIEIVSEGIDGWLVEQEGNVTVALDTVLNDELVAEGLARETVNRIQNLRKSANFEVTDRIEIVFDASELLTQAIEKQSAWIRNETLAFTLQEASNPSGEVVETFEIGKERLTLGIGRRK